MKLLLLAPYYPHAGHPFSGIFNERSALALRELCNHVEVLAPRPYVPPLLSPFASRWKTYAQIAAYEVRDGLPVHRPACLHIPWAGGAFWIDTGAFLWCRHRAIALHRRVRFDAIISFDLLGIGGLAWRLGRALDIPASGWGTGSDMHVPASSPQRQVLIQALKRLDLVFYQSHELLMKSSELLGVPLDQLAPDRHRVLPRGIPAPPLLPSTKVRNRIRTEWGITRDQVLVLYIGRILRQKGLCELIDAMHLAATHNPRPRVTCVLIGSKPAFDETAIIKKKIQETPGAKDLVRLLPACRPDLIWGYLYAADVFAFPSHNEGMPNSLLEAMAVGVPSIAFAIPAVLEIDAGTGGIVTVPPMDITHFAQAILRLASAPDERTRIGEKGRAQVMQRFLVHKNMAKAVQGLAQAVEKRRKSYGLNAHVSS